MGANNSQEDDAPTMYGGMELENGAALGVYFDPTQGDSDGQLIVTQRCLENYNPWTADRRKRSGMDSETLTCSAFRAASTVGSIVAVGTEAGNMYVLDASSFDRLKSVNLGKKGNVGNAAALAASEGVELSEAGANSSSSPRNEACRITSIMIMGEDFLICGDSLGVTHFFKISSGDAFLTIDYKPPAMGNYENKVDEESDKAGLSCEISSFQCFKMRIKMDDPNLTHVVVIGHENGLICFYTLKGELVKTLSGGPTNLLAMAYARSMSTLICLYVGNNVMWAWDIETGIPQVLEFNKELENLNQQQSVATCMRYDNIRDILVTGSNDGSFFIRKLHRDPETKSFASRLLRFGIPPAPMPTLTTLSYHSDGDRLYTGDITGCCRIVHNASGFSSHNKK
mmetsp:Transcript_22520/g.29465  ORF Transcript_22520/g.29465 Transcript_22520/m.29465 type:complete len:398 (+) Transcript_22520:107-1300(+)